MHFSFSILPGYIGKKNKQTRGLLKKETTPFKATAGYLFSSLVNPKMNTEKSEY